MRAHTTISFLLAVVASLFLFGKEAVLHAFLIILFVVIATIGFWFILAWARAGLKRIRSSLVSEWKSNQNPLTRLALVLGCIFNCMAFLIGAHTIWLWFSGTSKPLDAAVSSPLGHALGGLALVLIVGTGLVLAGKGVLWLIASRERVPDIAGYYARIGLRAYLEFLLSPVTFPMRRWRLLSLEGAGPAAKMASIGYVIVVALVIWLITVLATFLVICGVLLWLGVIS